MSSYSISHRGSDESTLTILAQFDSNNVVSHYRMAFGVPCLRMAWHGVAGLEREPKPSVLPAMIRAWAGELIPISTTHAAPHPI